MIGSARVGERRLLALLEEYGAPTVGPAIDAILDENRSFPPPAAFARGAAAADPDVYARADADPEGFWAAVWQFCGVVASETGDTVLVDADRFPGARWFPDAQLNFAENLLRRRDEHPALVSVLENGARRELSYAQLHDQVAALASSLRKQGVVCAASKNRHFPWSEDIRRLVMQNPANIGHPHPSRGLGWCFLYA